MPCSSEWSLFTQLLQRRDALIVVIGLAGRDAGRHQLDLVDEAELDRGDADLARERRGRREGEFHDGPLY
jgi:hypothetical protein